MYEWREGEGAIMEKGDECKVDAGEEQQGSVKRAFKGGKAGGNPVVRLVLEKVKE